ncbi:MAG: hypothetical protein ACM3JJ_01975 [Hyphomicrobiales bacterium]
MQLELTEHDSQVLRQLLRDYLPSLEREAARTEDRDLRHDLVERQNLIERLLEQFGAAK